MVIRSPAKPPWPPIAWSALLRKRLQQEPRAARAGLPGYLAMLLQFPPLAPSGQLPCYPLPLPSAGLAAVGRRTRMGVKFEQPGNSRPAYLWGRARQPLQFALSLG